MNEWSERKNDENVHKERINVCEFDVPVEVERGMANRSKVWLFTSVSVATKRIQNRRNERNVKVAICAILCRGIQFYWWKTPKKLCLLL